MPNRTTTHPTAEDQIKGFESRNQNSGVTSFGVEPRFGVFIPSREGQGLTAQTKQTKLVKSSPVSHGVEIVGSIVYGMVEESFRQFNANLAEKVAGKPTFCVPNAKETSHDIPEAEKTAPAEYDTGEIADDLHDVEDKSPVLHDVEKTASVENYPKKIAPDEPDVMKAELGPMAVGETMINCESNEEVAPPSHRVLVSVIGRQFNQGKGFF